MTIILRIIFLLLCASSVVHDNLVFKRNVNENANVISELSQGLYAFKVMFQSTSIKAQWSHLALLIKVMIALYFLVHQLCGIVKNEKELEVMDEQYQSVKHKVRGVSLFHEGTEAQFGNLNIKSASIMEWFKTIESNNITRDDELNNELESLQKSFRKQQAIFSKYEIDLDEKPLTSCDIRAQLTMANGYVGKTLGTIKADIAEDILTIGDIKRDVRSLKAYFGKFLDFLV